MTDLRIITADVRAGLAQLESDSIQCVVTSPPYWGLRDYGVSCQIGLEPTVNEFVDTMTAVFREVRRVLRPDGTLWLNMGDCYAGSWGAQGRSGSMADRSVVSARQIEAHPQTRYGTGSLSRTPGLKPKDLVGMPWRLAFALQADGWYLRSDIIWAKPNPMPESVTDRPTKTHEYIFLMTQAQRYFYNADAVKVATLNPHDNRRARQNPTDYAEKTGERGTLRSVINPATAKTYQSRNLRTVWTIPAQPYPGGHCATFPPSLPERCIKAGSRPGDIVLDPFAGAGTTLLVARALGRHAIGIELNPEYAEIARRRCSAPWELPAETTPDDTQSRLSFDD